MIERRQRNRKTKTIAFLTVTGVFLIVLLAGDRYPWVDHVSHFAVVAFLGARIFMRSI
jgi:hypothetical protein